MLTSEHHRIFTCQKSSLRSWNINKIDFRRRHRPSAKGNDFNRLSRLSLSPDTATSSRQQQSSNSLLICHQSSNDYNEILSYDDVVIGVIIAFLLAFTASFLQGRRAQNDFSLSNDQFENEKDDDGEETIERDESVGQEIIISSSTTFLANDTTTTDDPTATATASGSKGNNKVVFDKESWDEMKRPDNYIFYNQKLRERRQQSKKEFPQTIKEQKWVVLALLTLFVPLFGIELFFALSRQFICGTTSTTIQSSSDWNQLLCSPVSVTTIIP